jgi:hypothetical protein
MAIRAGSNFTLNQVSCAIRFVRLRASFPLLCKNGRGEVDHLLNRACKTLEQRNQHAA